MHEKVNIVISAAIRSSESIQEGDISTFVLTARAFQAEFIVLMG
jgi:hypothetical protein